MNSPSKCWSAFPSHANPKLWIDADDRISVALNLYHPYSTNGRAVKFLLSLVPDSVGRLFLGSPAAGPDQETLRNFNESICAILNHPHAIASFSTGTPGPHRKITAQISDAGKIIAYVKIAESDAARKLLANEAAMLQWLQENRIPNAVTPELLAHTRHGAQDMLYQSANAAPGKQRPLLPTPLDAQFLGGLAQHHQGNKSFQEMLRIWEQRGLCTPDNLDNCRQDTTWNNALNHLGEAFKENDIPCGPTHGDYAPWNTLLLGNGDIYVFDWEYGEPEGALINDLLHCHFMPLRLVRKSTPYNTIKALLALPENKAFLPLLNKLGIKSEHFPAHVLLYLLHQMLRETGSNKTIDPYLTACAHATLIAAHDKFERRRVLVAAYACEPGEGSEPGVGWNMSCAASKYNDVWVITRQNNRSVIEAELKQNPNTHLHFEYVDLPYWARFWKKGGRGLRTYYYLWQLWALKRARHLDREVHFDLGHHLTFVNDWMYSFLALMNIPFVWGPIGSNPPAPLALVYSRQYWLKDFLRRIVQKTVRLLDPLFWLTVRNASFVVGINRGIHRQFPLSLLPSRKFSTQLAIGVENIAEPLRRDSGTTRPLCILSTGKLLPIKGFHLALEAFARFHPQHPDAQFVIIGKGPLKTSIENRIAQLGLTENVILRDWLPREELLAEMQRADIFLYPTMEGAGMVLLEAMANQLPVVCLDFGGGSELVDDQCGHRIKPGSHEQTILGLSGALDHLANDPALREAMGCAGKIRVEEFYLWEGKSRIMEQWYKAALDQ